MRKKSVAFLFLLPFFFLLSCGGELGGEDDDGPVHFQGQSCGSCHNFSGGTVFKSLHAGDKDANNAANGYSVKLIFQNGNVYTSNYGRGVGNFIVPKGRLQDWFRAVVIDSSGNEVNSSIKNSYSHSPDRFECNSCHTQSGANGAPGRIVNYDYYGGQ